LLLLLLGLSRRLLLLWLLLLILLWSFGLLGRFGVGLGLPSLHHLLELLLGWRGLVRIGAHELHEFRCAGIHRLGWLLLLWRSWRWRRWRYMLLLIELIRVMIVHLLTVLILLILVIVVVLVVTILLLSFIIVLLVLPVRVVVRVSLLRDLVDAHLEELILAHLLLQVAPSLLLVITIELLPCPRQVLVLRLLFALGTILRVARGLFVGVGQLRETPSALIDLEV
jgi:hypothetical protein